MKITASLLILILIISTGCSKYDEGSFFTIRTKKGRITNTWVPQQYIYPDGTIVKDVVGGTIELKRDMNASMGIELNGSVVKINGTWEFINNKAGVNVTLGALGFSQSDNYEIIKLTSKELWVKDENEIVTHFEAE